MYGVIKTHKQKNYNCFFRILKLVAQVLKKKILCAIAKYLR